VVVVQSRAAFILPFKSLDELLQSNPFAARLPSARALGGIQTPHEPIPRIAS